MPVQDLTVLVLVRDVEEILPRCLESVAWADDIFCVVDPRSKDQSAEVARKYTEHVVDHEFFNPGHQRNWAIPQIKTEWTLVLDSDEWVSDPLAKRIQALVRDPNSVDAYSIKRDNYFFGKLIRHCGWHRDYNLRLFRTNKGRYQRKRAHEKILIEGNPLIASIREPMFHDSYRSFSEYYIGIERFSTWGAEDLYEKGRHASFADLALRPLIRFFKMYVLRHGFLDGYHGLVLCGLAACSVFLKYAKLWNLWRLDKEGKVELSEN